MGSIALSMTGNTFLARDNRSHIYSIAALTEEMENIRGVSFNTFLALGDGSTFTNDQVAKLGDGATGTRYIDTSFGGDIRKLTLTVTWTNLNGIARSESMTTYVTRSGINGQ